MLVNYSFLEIIIPASGETSPEPRKELQIGSKWLCSILRGTSVQWCSHLLWYCLTLRIITILGHLDKPNYHLVQGRGQPSINRFKMTSLKTNEDLIETNRLGSLQMILMLGITPLCNTSIVNRGSLVQSLNHATPSGIQCSLQKTQIGVGRANLWGFTIDKGCKVPARWKETRTIEEMATLAAWLFVAQQANKWLISQILDNTSLVQPDWDTTAWPWETKKLLQGGANLESLSSSLLTWGMSIRLSTHMLMVSTYG